MLHAIVAILGGAIAASPLIIERRPSSAGFLKSISEYRAFFGIVLTFWGFVGLIKVLYRGVIHVGGLMQVCLYAAEFVVGFLLAYELIHKYILSKNSKASEIGQDMKSGFTKYEIPAGVALIVLGILSLFN